MKCFSFICDDMLLYRGVRVLEFFIFNVGCEVDCFVNWYVVFFIEIDRFVVVIRWRGWGVYKFIYIIIGKVRFWGSI